MVFGGFLVFKKMTRGGTIEVYKTMHGIEKSGQGELFLSYSTRNRMKLLSSRFSRDKRK